MLTKEEQTAFHESIGRVRLLAAKKLSQFDDAGHAVEFIANLHRGLDTVVLLASELGPTPDCRIKCSHCCYVRVEATDPEIFRIVRHIRQRPTSEVNDLTVRLRRRVSNDDAGVIETKQGCTFLVNNLCTIYEVRPAACRKAHSLSLEQCETFAPEISQNLKLIVEAEALMAGTSSAYHEVGLLASAHELNSAVLTALNDDTAEARWYDGENIF